MTGDRITPAPDASPDRGPRDDDPDGCVRPILAGLVVASTLVGGLLLLGWAAAALWGAR